MYRENFYKTIKLLVILTAILFISSVIISQKQAFSQISSDPSAVLVEDRESSVTVTLTNTSNSEQTYRLQWQEFNEQELQRHSARPNGEVRGLSDFSRFSPRQVTLGSGAQQTIRILFQRPSDLGVGNYRAFLRIQGQPVAMELRADGQEQPEATVDMVFTMDVPITMRHRVDGPE